MSKNSLRVPKPPPMLAWMKICGRPGFSRAFLFVSIVLAVSLATPPALAQLVHPGLPPDPSGRTPGAPDTEDETQRQMAKKLELRRNEERQKQLVKDTDQLLALATQLKSEVDKTDKNVLSVAVIKKAEEIEKLAKNVRDRMKSQ